jgi:hypothetical protein
MGRQAVPTRRGVQFGGALAALVLLAACPLTAAAAERVVLGEEFTATW